MKIQGSTEKAKEFLLKLNPKKLVDLTADILAVKGHHDIKIMDGPGDGCRDIHSIDKNGDKHLTQCKYHKDLNKTVSSKEIGELPLGLVKLDYEKGLFCTNAKLSPQSKREFLDNYPKLNLDFWEGSNIPSIIFENMLIRSIWFDGKSIDRISYVIVIPTIARDIQKNKSIPLSELLEVDKIVINHEIYIQLRNSSINYSNFEPYLPPKIRTIKEGWGWGTCLELVIYGPVRFEEISKIQRNAAHKIISSITKNKIFNIAHLALRLGKPHLSPLAGESAGSHIEINCEPLTLIKHNSDIKSEREWLLPTPNFDWYEPSMVQSSMANWVRWYNPRIDICLDLNILSIPSGSMLGVIEEQYEYFLKWWKKSLFALVQNNLTDQFNHLKIDQPTKIIEWYKNQALCCWHPGKPATGIRHMLIESDDIGEEPELSRPFEVNPEDYEKSYTELKNKLKKVSALLIEPQKARHMIASKLSDPYPSKDQMIYRAIELMYNYQKIPSPIDPKSRRIIFTKAWIISENEKLNTDDNFLKNIEILLSQSTDWTLNASVFDNNTTADTYYVLYLENSDEIGFMDTNQELNKILKSYLNLVSEIEKLIKLTYPNAKSGRIRFWENEIGMYFKTIKLNMANKTG